MDITEDAPPDVQDDETTLVSMDTVPMDTSIPEIKESPEKKMKKQKHSGRSGKKKKEVLVAPVEEVEEVEEKGDLDDLEFWLSKGDAPTPKTKQVQCIPPPYV